MYSYDNSYPNHTHNPILMNPLRKIWAEGRTSFDAFLSIPNSWSAEVMAHAGFDSLTIDMQHGMMDFQTTLNMLQAIGNTDTVPLIRLPWNDPAITMHVLDAGARGVICPTINSAEEVEALVSACRYPPRGFRSYGPLRATIKMGPDYAKVARQEVLVFAMIETAKAAEQLEAIASVPDLDGLFVGPYDLSVSLGLENLADIYDPKLKEVLDRILATCKAKNLIAGIFTGKMEDAKTLAEWGFQHVSHTHDSAMLTEIAKAKVKFLKNL